jgi:hypothetical protein
MDPDAAAILPGELAPHERLLWAGRPPGGIRFRAADFFLVPFSLMWGGFAFFWEGSVIALHGPVFFQAWGVPFVLVGAYLIAGRFVVDALRRAKTSYGVTSERILVVSDWFSHTVTSQNLRTLGDVSVRPKGDGSGTITFGALSGPRWGIGATWPGLRSQAAPSFEGIPQVRTVEEIIRRAQADASR